MRSLAQSRASEPAGAGGRRWLWPCESSVTYGATPAWALSTLALLRTAQTSASRRSPDQTKAVRQDAASTRRSIKYTTH